MLTPRAGNTVLAGPTVTSCVGQGSVCGNFQARLCHLLLFRLIISKVKFGSGAEISGSTSANHGPIGPAPVIYGADAFMSSPTAAALCAPGSLDPTLVQGKIVVSPHLGEGGQGQTLPPDGRSYFATCVFARLACGRLHTPLQVFTKARKL